MTGMPVRLVTKVEEKDAMSILDSIERQAGDNARTLNRGVHGDRPPVVILNMYYSGLGIARELAGKGVRVVGLSSERKIYGNFTRLCEVRQAPNSQDAPEQLAEFLLRSKDDLAGAVIFPTRDADVIFLEHFRSELEPCYRLAIPPSECLRRTIDKYELAVAALGAGVPVPRTLRLTSAEQLARVPIEVGFPCVVKPISSYQWRIGGAWQQVGCRKAFRVDNAAMLRKEYDQIAKVAPQVLVQEWIAGGVDQIVVLGGYVGNSSELLAYFTARKILQSPDEFGTGCVVQSEAVPAIVDPTRYLLHALKYKGLAEVEYKQDALTGEYKLIEVNTRHWDQHELGRAGGVNLTWVAYCDLTGKNPPQERGPIVPTKWIAEDALLLHVIRNIARAEWGSVTWRQTLIGPRIYGIFHSKDPLPFIRHFCFSLVPMLAKMLLRSFRNGLRSH